jgi:hypothetical protein
MVYASVSCAFVSQLSKHRLGELTVYPSGDMIGGMMGSGLIAFLIEDVSIAPFADGEILRSLIGIAVLH